MGTQHAQVHIKSKSHKCEYEFEDELSSLYVRKYCTAQHCNILNTVAVK